MSVIWQAELSPQCSQQQNSLHALWISSRSNFLSAAIYRLANIISPSTLASHNGTTESKNREERIHRNKDLQSPIQIPILTFPDINCSLTRMLCPEHNSALLHPPAGVKGILRRRRLLDRGFRLPDMRYRRDVLGHTGRDVPGP